MHRRLTASEHPVKSPGWLVAKHMTVLVQVSETGLGNQGSSPLHPVRQTLNRFVPEGKGIRAVQHIIGVDLIRYDGVRLNPRIQKRLIGTLIAPAEKPGGAVIRIAVQLRLIEHQQSRIPRTGLARHRGLAASALHHRASLRISSERTVGLPFTSYQPQAPCRNPSCSGRQRGLI